MGANKKVYCLREKCRLADKVAQLHVHLHLGDVSMTIQAEALLAVGGGLGGVHLPRRALV